MKSDADKLLDKTYLNFGRYRGRSPEQIARIDPGYIVWLYDNVEPKRCSRELALDCESAVDDNEDADRYDPNDWR